MIVDLVSIRRANFSITSALAVALCSCSSADQPASNDLTTHPNASYIIGGSAGDRSVNLSDAGQTDEVGEAVNTAIARGAVLTLGAEERPPEQVFGEITDVAIDGLGRLYVLDARIGEIRVFDARGSLVQTVGKPGRGPGEFLRATAVALDSAGTLYVGDVARRIHRFARTASDALAYDTAFSLPVVPEDICIRGTELVVHGISTTDSSLLYRYTPDGKALAAFGVLYRSPHVRANMEAARGRIACSTETGIYYAPAGLLGEVRAFSFEGAQRWRTTFTGFKPVHVTANQTRFSVRLPPEGYNRIDALTLISDTALLAQVVHVMPPSDTSSIEGVSSAANVILDTRTGEAYVNRSAVRRIVAWNSTAFISATEEPYPTISFFSLRADGARK